MTPPDLNQEARWALEPFVTSLIAPVYSFRNLPPQLTGALFSRASRAKGDLREILWNEYFYPILHPEEINLESSTLRGELREVIEFYRHHSSDKVYNSQRAFTFFAKWLSQYGDESIAQMASTNLVAVGLSQPSIKFLEDQRIGVAPIEKSTRFVDYSAKVDDRYLYYENPDLEKWGLAGEYRRVMDGLFDTYAQLIPQFVVWLKKQYPEEKDSVLEKKAFDELRGFLPMATISQVAFHGNAQAFKYMIDRCAAHPRWELRWFAQEARKALSHEIPSLLLRLDDETTKAYQQERWDRKNRVREILEREFDSPDFDQPFTEPSVRLIWSEPLGQERVIAGLLFAEGNSGLSYSSIYQKVIHWSDAKKAEVLEAHFKERKDLKNRWQKVGRALELAFVHFEIVMNTGAYRDLHRHRMHTQERQRFTTRLGYELPGLLRDFGIERLFREKMQEVDALFRKVEAVDPEAAQDIPTLFHFCRFYQFQNLRQAFWEIELRTISQARPDYKQIELEKLRILMLIYPMIAKHILADTTHYELARRGQEEKTEKREKRIKSSKSQRAP